MRATVNIRRDGRKDYKLFAMMKAKLTFSSQRANSNGVVVLKVTGPITLDNIGDFQRELAKNRPPLMVFDLSEVPYMDSSGVGVLISYYSTGQREGRRMVLAGLTERVGALLKLTKVLTVLRSYPTVEEAVSQA
jgi:anti-anti-sigma factor